MKSIEYISEIIEDLEPEQSAANALLLKEFSEKYEIEIRYKILEMWSAFLQDKNI